MDCDQVSHGALIGNVLAGAGPDNADSASQFRKWPELTVHRAQ